MVFFNNTVLYASLAQLFTKFGVVSYGDALVINQDTGSSVGQLVFELGNILLVFSSKTFSLGKSVHLLKNVCVQRPGRRSADSMQIAALKKPCGPFRKPENLKKALFPSRKNPEAKRADEKSYSCFLIISSAGFL